MVTLDGAEPDLAAMGGGSSAEGSLEATDDEDALMTDEEVDVGAHDRNNQRQGGKEVDSPTTKSKQTSENDGGANLDRSGHSDGSVRSAEDGATNEATTLAKKQPKATLKPPARVLFGVYEAQGQRPYMEDRYAIIEDWKFECAGKRSQNNYYNNMNNGQQEQIISDKQYIGVYDGHNGDWAASYAKEKMHTHLEKCAFIANGIAPDAPVPLVSASAAIAGAVRSASITIRSTKGTAGNSPCSAAAGPGLLATVPRLPARVAFAAPGRRADCFFVDTSPPPPVRRPCNKGRTCDACDR